MPHFAVDESAHGHRKVVRAGNAAFGLWVRLGSYACDHLTDGFIPAEIAAMYGTAPQLKKLTTVGMLHPAGHACRRCPQPESGDYVMHDYIGPNPSRAQVDQRRAHATEKKRKQRAETDPAANRERNDDESKTNRDGFDDEKSSNRTPFSGEAAGSEGLSPRDENQTRAHARPSPPPNPPSPSEKEKEEETASYARETPRIGDRPRIPAASQPLVDALYTAGLVVGWDMQPAEWFLIEALIQRCGIPALVVSATGSWQGARTQPRSGRYFLPAWRSLPDAPAQPERQQEYLPAVVGGNVHQLPNPGHRPSTTDARVNQAIETGRRLQALADAQRAQENQ